MAAVEDCVEACNSQRYAAQAIDASGGCLAYSYNAAEKSSCFGGARDEDGQLIAKAGECLLYGRVATARALAKNDTKLTYGAIEASAIPGMCWQEHRALVLDYFNPALLTRLLKKARRGVPCL